MATISLSLPSDGQTIDAADVNTPLNTISAVINGNLDDDNVKVGANINGTKLLINSIPPTAGDANMRGGWNAGIVTAMPTVTALGNRSYSLVHATTDLTGYLSPGMRLKLTRTVTAPTQCTSLNGTTQYYSKTTPAGMTFTDDFVVSAWIKLSAYAQMEIASKYNATSGWIMRLLSSGQVTLIGINAGSSNTSAVTSYQSVPLNKWVHVTAQLDMSTFTATTTTSYVMIDGVDVPVAVARSGTNPTSLINNVGNLEIGSSNGGSNFFGGKIAQVAIYSAKVTQATILASMNQTLTGSETSLISAYSFNGVITDLNTSNANNLTANGSAVATTLDTPFTQTMTGVTTGTTNYGIITAASFSTNTTLTVQVAEGDTIPTSGGVSAVSYSTQKAPYGMPIDTEKFSIYVIKRSDSNQVPVSNTVYNLGGLAVTIPVGKWNGSYWAYVMGRAANIATITVGLSLATNTLSDLELASNMEFSLVNGILTWGAIYLRDKNFEITTPTAYYLNMSVVGTTVNNLDHWGGRQQTTIKLTPLFL